MNGHTGATAEKSLIEHIVQYRNQAEQLRISAQSAHEDCRAMLLSLAETYDAMARAVQNMQGLI